jgi:hypothetical protein
MSLRVRSIAVPSVLVRKEKKADDGVQNKKKTGSLVVERGNFPAY